MSPAAPLEPRPKPPGRPCHLDGGWPGRPQRLIERYAQAGRTARQAAKALGTTKSAVLARANRTGVRFEPAPETLAAIARKAGRASARARRARNLRKLEAMG